MLWHTVSPVLWGTGFWRVWTHKGAKMDLARLLVLATVPLCSCWWWLMQGGFAGYRTEKHLKSAPPDVRCSVWSTNCSEGRGRIKKIACWRFGVALQRRSPQPQGTKADKITKSAWLWCACAWCCLGVCSCFCFCYLHFYPPYSILLFVVCFVCLFCSFLFDRANGASGEGDHTSK